MNLNEFQQQMRRLLVAFGSDVKSERIDFYFKFFEKYPADVFKYMVDEVLSQERTFPSIAALRKYEDQAFHAYRRDQEQIKHGNETICADCKNIGWVFFDRNFNMAYQEGYCKACHCSFGDGPRALLVKEKRYRLLSQEELAYLRFQKHETMVDGSEEIIELRDLHVPGSKMWKALDRCLINYQKAHARENGELTETSSMQDSQSFMEEAESFLA